MSPISGNLKNKNFVCFWLGQLVSQFGERINQMALIWLVAARAPGSALELAKILSFTIIPVFILGPIAAVYVDRWDRRTTMYVCDFLRGALILTIPFIFLARDSMIPIYVVVFLVFCLGRFYIPAKMSIIPDLVGSEYLLAANSMVTITGMIAFVFGVFFGAMIVEQFQAYGGFICNAITYFASALLILSISRGISLKVNPSAFITTGVSMITDIKKSVPMEIKESFGYLKNHTHIRFIVNTLFTLMAAAGAIYVILIVFVQQVFGSVTRDLGFLAPVLGVGLFTGSLIYGRLGRAVSEFKAIFFSLISGGIMLTAFAVGVNQLPSRPFAMVLTFLLGMIASPIFIASNTIVHRACDASMRGKVFGGLEVVMHFAFLVAMFLSGYLAEFIPPFLILTGVGVIFSLVGVLGLVRYNKSGAFTEELQSL